MPAAPTPLPPSSPGVIVAGMHRSGTSVVARTLHGLGLALARRDDLMGAAASNPTGHFESWSLTELNDELLLALGGTWSAPPDLAPGWEEEPVAASMVERASRVFARAHPEHPWVWKDPRASLLLPFWSRVLGAHPVVLVFRHPAEVARSVELRDGHPPPLGVALWARYVRSALHDAGGLPAFVAGWDRLHRDPEGWTGSLSAWLSDVGIPPSPEPARGHDAVAVDPSVGQVHLDDRERDGFPAVGPEDRALYELLVSLEGPHETLPRVDGPEEPPARATMLAERRRVEVEAILRRGTAGEASDDQRRYIARLEGELRRQVEAHERITAYAREIEDDLRGRDRAAGEVRDYVGRLEEDLRRKDRAAEEVRAHVRHLEEEIRKKEAHIQDLTERLRRR
ncbi:MAG: hypothetical protein ACRDI0_00195 [Actinomycetota bacterium]